MPGDEVDDENEEAQGSDFDMEGDDNKESTEYVKKEFHARPYVSPYNTEDDVNKLNPKNSR